MTWHLSADVLRSYAAGSVADIEAWSVEAHLTECERCRGLLSEASRADDGQHERLDDRWAVLAAELPVQGDVRAGTTWREAWLLVASGPAARWAWLAASAVVLALAAALGMAGPEALLGVVAPLIPVLGVAASYGSRFDGPSEIIATTPAGGLRLVLTRAAAVLGVTTPIAVVAGVVTGYGSPGPWLAACLALTLVTLALGTAIGIERAAAVLAVTWLVAVGGSHLDTAWPVVLSAGAVPWFLALAAAAAVVVTMRRESFRRLPVQPRIEVPL